MKDGKKPAKKYFYPFFFINLISYCIEKIKRKKKHRNNLVCVCMLFSNKQMHQLIFETKNESNIIISYF